MIKKDNQLKITISGYDVAAIEEATRLVIEKISQLKLNFSIVCQPTKKKTVTTLISPHKHKGAQEKFDQETHKRVIYIANISPTDFEILEKLRVPNTADIEVKSSF